MSKKEKAKPGFQTEPIELRNAILARGHIEPWEMLRICAWKSAKGLAWLTLNTEDEIRSYTREAITVLKATGSTTDVLNGNLSEDDWNSWETKAGDLIGADAKHGGPSGLLRLHGRRGGARGERARRRAGGCVECPRAAGLRESR